VDAAAVRQGKGKRPDRRNHSTLGKERETTMDITLSIRITDTDWSSKTSSTVTREVRFEYPDDYDMLVRMNFGAIADDTLRAAIAEYLAPLATPAAAAASESEAQ